MTELHPADRWALELADQQASERRQAVRVMRHLVCAFLAGAAVWALAAWLVLR